MFQLGIIISISSIFHIKGRYKSSSRPRADSQRRRQRQRQYLHHALRRLGPQQQRHSRERESIQVRPDARRRRLSTLRHSLRILCRRRQEVGQTPRFLRRPGVGFSAVRADRDDQSDAEIGVEEVLRNGGRHSRLSKLRDSAIGESGCRPLEGLRHRLSQRHGRSQSQLLRQRQGAEKAAAAAEIAGNKKKIIHGLRHGWLQKVSIKLNPKAISSFYHGKSFPPSLPTRTRVRPTLR